MNGTHNPSVLVKATSATVHDNGDGSWRVQSTSGSTYSVYRIGDRFKCTCPAGHGGTLCSHREAVCMSLEANPRPTPALDALTAEIVKAMSLRELSDTLVVAMFALAEVAVERQAQNTRLADLKIKKNRYKILGEKTMLEALDDELLVQKAIVDNLRIRHSALKGLQSSLQSTMRMAGQ